MTKHKAEAKQRLYKFDLVKIWRLIKEDSVLTLHPISNKVSKITGLKHDDYLVMWHNRLIEQNKIRKRRWKNVST